MTPRLSRRIVLRGLGGACVVAPFLSSLAERGAKAQASKPPQRLIVMFTHYGCVTNNFFPAKSHGPLAASDFTVSTLEPLAPFIDKLLMPRGIRAMNEWTAKMLRGQGNDTHTQVVGSYFTCQPVTPNSDMPFSFEPATRFNAMPVGPSLDHIVCQQLGQSVQPLHMRVGNATETPQTGISYSARETPFQGLGQPSEILGRLTGLFKDGAPSPDSYRAVRGKSILDLVEDDLATLQRIDMSQADRRKLEAWKALLDETGGMVSSSQCTAANASRAGATQPNVNAFDALPSGSDVLTAKIAGELDGADLYSNLAVLAALCNATPVITLKYPANYLFSGLGLKVESHALSHRVANAGMVGCLADATQMLATIDSYYARKFAYLLKLLNDIEEGDRKLLDNTATVWFQEMSDGNAHNLNNLPILQAGSAGGYFKTGWAVNVDDGSATLSRGNSIAACGPGLDTVPSTGTDPAFANAPINKYYCTLMNALGIKAGADGFPQRGGAQEVTHFGMYDRTEDFVGGGVNPPKINNPGEFSVLRA